MADLIYEELCLRQEHGLEVPLEQVLQRFPQWRPQLEVLFDCQRLLGSRPAAPQFPAYQAHPFWMSPFLPLSSGYFLVRVQSFVRVP